MKSIDDNTYTIELLKYYGESETKKHRRIKLLKLIMEYIVFEQNYNATMSNISAAINVERKSIYRYFESRDDILVDLAYILVTSNNLEYLKVSKQILNDKKVPCSEKFSAVLKAVTDVMKQRRKELTFLAYFDDQFNIMSEDSPAKERYRKLITGFKTKNHYLRDVILFLDQKKLLDQEIEKEYIIEIVEQMINSFVSRTLKKEKESYRFQVENIDIAIRILEKGVIKK